MRKKSGKKRVEYKSIFQRSEVEKVNLKTFRMTPTGNGTVGLISLSHICHI